MPVLNNHRYEIFAQELAKGTTRIKAHEIAGYKPNDGNATTLAAKPEIQERIKEIKENAGLRAEITVERVLAEIGKIGFANMADFTTTGADGLPFVDFTSLTRDQKAAIQEITVETRTEMAISDDGKKEAVPVRKVRLKLWDKRAALVDLGKHLGMFIERHEHGEPGEFAAQSDRELYEAMCQQAAELGIPLDEGTKH